MTINDLKRQYPDFSDCLWHWDDDEGSAIAIGCNDHFWWGVADHEDITNQDAAAIGECIAECLALGGTVSDGCYLWVGRKREMRPQGAVYTYIPASLWPLFDACGPEREVGLGNPCAPGTYNPITWETVYMGNRNTSPEG